MRPLHNALLHGAAALIVLSNTAPAQAAVRDAVDVQDYDISLILPDSGPHISGDVGIRVRMNGAPRLVLDLVRTLTVESVAVDGVVMPFERAGDSVVVRMPAGVNEGVVRVRYAGDVQDGLIVRRDGRGRWTWFGDNWPDRARQWLPTVDHPSDKATVSWRVAAPVGRAVVANGTLTGTRPVVLNGVTRTETRWRESRRIATYLMVIGAGPLTRFPLADASCVASAAHSCVAQDVYVMPENVHTLPGAFAQAPAIVRLFETLVDVFPYEKLSHLQSATRFGGMENASAIFYSDALFPQGRVRDGLIAHETAHQWFGDAVTEREWGHLWLSEGFATYFAALWTRAAHGDRAFADELAGIRSQILRDSVVMTRPVIDSTQRDLLALLNTNSYQKGGYVLAMLHRELGDSAFFRGVRSYYRAHVNGTATSDDLRTALEASSGRDLRAFFDQWLRRPGVATVTLGWAWNAATSRVEVLALQPSGAPYALHVPVTIIDAEGLTHDTAVDIPANARSSTVVTGAFSVRPRALMLDSANFLLARVARL